MSLQPASRDVFIRQTDPTGKRPPVITQHLAWDPTLFIASQVQQYEVDAKPDERRLISIATVAEFRAQQKKGR